MAKVPEECPYCGNQDDLDTIDEDIDSDEVRLKVACPECDRCYYRVYVIDRQEKSDA